MKRHDRPHLAAPRALALACLLPLAACGGGDDEYQAGGSERESMVQAMVTDLAAAGIDAAPTDSWKPTIIMGKLSEALAASTVPLTATALISLVHSDKPATVREALARLIAEGYVTEGKRGRSTVLTLSKPYDGAPPKPAPEWREPPPEPESLFNADEFHPSEEDLAEIDRQRAFYDSPDF